MKSLTVNTSKGVLFATFDETGPDDQIITVMDREGRDLTLLMTPEENDAVGTAVAMWLLENGMWCEEDRVPKTRPS